MKKIDNITMGYKTNTFILEKSLPKEDIKKNKITVVSWNVNSIRARLEAFKKYLKEKNPDIILLQEIKSKNDFPWELVKLDYNIALHSQKSSGLYGRNGVAILSKYPIENVNTTLPKNPIPTEARYVEGTIRISQKLIKVISVYVPYGKLSMSNKLQFLTALKKRVKKLNPNKNVIIIGGDFNVDPDKTLAKLCCTANEKQKFQDLLDLGFYDSFRYLHPNKYLNGMRLDHCLISKKALIKLHKLSYYRQSKKETFNSKHIPIMTILKWKHTIEKNTQGNQQIIINSWLDGLVINLENFLYMQQITYNKNNDINI